MFKMKGTKEGKADGSKVSGPALFPRVHVSDTKKAGSRGPPRNRMALYEQLTIPSHKYKPSLVPLPSSGRMMMNTTMPTPIYQPQVQASSYDSRYSYMPMSYMSTMIPTMGYMPMMNVGVYGVGAGATAASSMNASSARSTVVDTSAESQRVPWGGETLSRRHSSSGQSKLSAPSRKRKEKGKEDDDFAVPTYSSATQASSQARPSANPFQGRQGFSEGRAVQKGKEVVLGKRSSPCEDDLRRIGKENSMEDDDSWTSASAECETVSAIDDDVNTLELRYRKMDVCPRDSDGSQMELNASEIGQERVKDQKIVVERSGEGLTKQSVTATRVAVPAEIAHEVDSLRAVPEQDIFSSQSSEDRSGEVSEPSQARRGSSAETESSTGSICFRDVVDAFGQQEFWKAQSTIIRQQKIFSRQVFELHRVIEVQQLLAKTSSLSLNYDETLEEEEADNVPMPASPVADVPVVPEIPERCPEANLNQSSDENSRPVPEALLQPIYPLSLPYQQNFNSGSAWQPAPYAANPWAARMSSPLMYAPYPGPCSPGYGAYPYMGASMPVYGNSGGVQAAGFPPWQQPGISQPWGAQESAAAAAAAWFSQQVVPPAGPMSSTGIVPPAYDSEHLTSSAVNQPIQGINASKGNAWQSGDGCDVEVNASKNCGWATGWGSTEERWDCGKRVVGLSGDEPDRREGETGVGDGGYGVGHQSDVRDQVAEHEERAHAGESSEPGRKLAESESENMWPAGARLEDPLQSRTLKRTRTEVPDSDIFPWFRMMSPAKRIMQQNGVIKVVPRAVTATPESAASILLSIQKERQC